jgi:hypothetical protein
MKPIDIAPNIFEFCKRKNWIFSQAFLNNSWIEKISIESSFSLEHLMQFMDLWALINNAHLQDSVEDNIIWKFIENGLYSTALAYKMQLLGLVHSSMSTIVWKAWAPPKVKKPCLSCSSK